MLTLLRTPKPIRWMAPSLRSGNGGWNFRVPFFSTPRGTVTSTASPTCHQDRPLPRAVGQQMTLGMNPLGIPWGKVLISYLMLLLLVLRNL